MRVDNNLALKLLSEGLARVATSGRVNGELVDLRTVVDSDSEVEILTFDNEEGKGAIIFINNVSNSENTMRKLQQFLDFQDGQEKRATLASNFHDYGIGTQILKNRIIR